MATIPKCTSWRGHKFEGRFSSEPASPPGRISVQNPSEKLVRELGTKRTYERDICVRCGVTVERESKPKEPETQATSN